MIDETFLTTEEVLEYLQVNLRTVYRLIKAGKIPAVRVGRQWRFRKRDIDAWLDSQRPRGGTRAAAPAAPPRPWASKNEEQRPRPRITAPGLEPAATNALDSAFEPHEVLRRPGSVRQRHVADFSARARRPVRPQRRRQDHAAADDGRHRRA